MEIFDLRSLAARRARLHQRGCQFLINSMVLLFLRHRHEGTITAKLGLINRRTLSVRLSVYRYLYLCLQLDSQLTVRL